LAVNVVVLLLAVWLTLCY